MARQTWPSSVQLFLLMTVCIGHTEPVDVPAANDEPNPTGNSQPPHKPKTFQLNYYHCDQIGAPQELTNEQGRIVWAAQYKVWGETQPLEFLKTGTDDAAVFSSRSRPVALANRSDAQALNLVEQPLRFQGQYFDAETGLHYNRFRYYDPVVGRFVHQDPIGLDGDINLFVFASNPLAWSDPFGLQKQCACGCGPYVNQDARWREPKDDPNTPKHIKGWIKNQERQVALGKQAEVKAPPGYDLKHRVGFEGEKGFDFSHADPALRADHQGIHHRYYRKRGGCWTVAMPKSGPRGRGKLSLPKPGKLPG